MKQRTLPAAVAMFAVALAMLPGQRTSAQLDETLPHRAVLPTQLPSPQFPIVPTVAPGYRAPDVVPSAAQIVGVTQERFVGISLQDAIAMALLKNPNLAISASSVRVARYTIVADKGAYDVQLQLKPSSSFSVQPPQNAFVAGPGELGRYTPAPGSTPGVIYTTGPGNIIQHESAFQYGIGGQSENGMTYQAGIQQSRTYNNSVFNAYNPYYIATLNLAVTQPLLKNGYMNAAKRQLKLAFVNADATTAQALVDSSNTHRAGREGVLEPRRRMAQRRDPGGGAARGDRTAAQQRASRPTGRSRAGGRRRIADAGIELQNNVYSALQTVSLLQVQLKSLVVADPGDPIWTANLVPSTSVLQLPEAGDLGDDCRRGAAEPARDPAGRREAALGGHRSNVCAQSIAAAGRRAGAVSQQRLRRHPDARARVSVGRVLSGWRRSDDVPDAAAKHPRQHGLCVSQHVGGLLSRVQHRADRQLSDSGDRLARGMRGVAKEEETQAKLMMQGVEERIGAEARNALQSYKIGTCQAQRGAQSRAHGRSRLCKRGAAVPSTASRRRSSCCSVKCSSRRRAGSNCRRRRSSIKSIVELQRVDGTILSKNGVNLQTLGTRRRWRIRRCHD